MRLEKVALKDKDRNLLMKKVKNLPYLLSGDSFLILFSTQRGKVLFYPPEAFLPTFSVGKSHIINKQIVQNSKVWNEHLTMKLKMTYQMIG